MGDCCTRRGSYYVQQVAPTPRQQLHGTREKTEERQGPPGWAQSHRRQYLNERTVSCAQTNRERDKERRRVLLNESRVSCAQNSKERRGVLWGIPKIGGQGTRIGSRHNITASPLADDEPTLAAVSTPPPLDNTGVWSPPLVVAGAGK